MPNFSSMGSNDHPIRVFMIIVILWLMNNMLEPNASKSIKRHGVPFT